VGITNAGSVEVPEKRVDQEHNISHGFTMRGRRQLSKAINTFFQSRLNSSTELRKAIVGRQQANITKIRDALRLNDLDEQRADIPDNVGDTEPSPVCHLTPGFCNVKIVRIGQIMCGVALLTLLIVGQPYAVITVLEIIRVVVRLILQGLLPNLVRSERS
jgi:hypothetical protein